MNYITCPKCKYSVSSENDFCSVCNYEFNTIIDEPFYVQSDKPYTTPSKTNPFVKELKDEFKDTVKGNLRFMAKRSLFKLAIIVGLTLAYVIYQGVVHLSFDSGSTAIVFFVCMLLFMRK